jgi:hypothetical protein
VGVVTISVRTSSIVTAQLSGNYLFTSSGEVLPSDEFTRGRKQLVSETFSRVMCCDNGGTGNKRNW